MLFSIISENKAIKEKIFSNDEKAIPQKVKKNDKGIER